MEQLDNTRDKWRHTRKMYNRRKIKSTMHEDIYDVIAGNVRARGAILVTQFASATAVAVAAASLAADANFLPVAEGEGQGRKIRKSRDRIEHFPKGKKEGKKKETKKRDERSVPF